MLTPLAQSWLATGLSWLFSIVFGYWSGRRFARLRFESARVQSGLTRDLAAARAKAAAWEAAARLRAAVDMPLDGRAPDWLPPGGQVREFDMILRPCPPHLTLDDWLDGAEFPPPPPDTVAVPRAVLSQLADDLEWSDGQDVRQALERLAEPNKPAYPGRPGGTQNAESD